jgi:hypothetical protein
MLSPTCGFITRAKPIITVAETRGQFGNPEEGECPPLKPVTRGMVRHNRLRRLDARHSKL